MISVFKEAKAAYRERKAEVVAARQYEQEGKPARRFLRAATVEDDISTSSSRRHSRHHHRRSRTTNTGRRHSSNASRSDSNTIYTSSQNRFSSDLGSPTVPSDTFTRRHSVQEDDFELPRPPPLPVRSMTLPPRPLAPIDMDLAYGPIPPPLAVVRQVEEEEFKGLVKKVKRILEEADCLQYSATATIACLQQNPEAMAAVALTLAEISNMAKGLAPSALVAMKGSSPAVFALLASPQFLIAGGMAVGVTIVAFGGYKIIKRIRAKNGLESPGVDEMLEIGGDVSTIDSWRRGIAEVEEQSVGTSVDGEFITPQAIALSRLNLNEHQTPPSLVSSRSSRKKRSSRSGVEKGSETSSKTSSRVTSREKKEKQLKKPSPLRLMFH